MSRKEWVVVLVVILVGIVLQIPGGLSDPGQADGNVAVEASATAAAVTEAGPYRTVALEVTGMT